MPQVTAHAALVNLLVSLRAGDPEQWRAAAAETIAEAMAVFEAVEDHAGLAKAWRLLAWTHGTACDFGKAAESLGTCARGGANRRRRPPGDTGGNRVRRRRRAWLDPSGRGDRALRADGRGGRGRPSGRGHCPRAAGKPARDARVLRRGARADRSCLRDPGRARSSGRARKRRARGVARRDVRGRPPASRGGAPARARHARGGRRAYFVLCSITGLLGQTLYGLGRLDEVEHSSRSESKELASEDGLDDAGPLALPAREAPRAGAARSTRRSHSSARRSGCSSRRTRRSSSSGPTSTWPRFSGLPAVRRSGCESLACARRFAEAKGSRSWPARWTRCPPRRPSRLPS